MKLRFIKKCAALGGWVLLFLLVWQFRSRLTFKVDSWFQKAQGNSHWEQIVKTKNNNLHEVSWEDNRPLILMLGDSHVEMGNWYDLFHGRFAIRNAGLSQSKIKDVTTVAKGITTDRPDMAVLLCGVNDLGGGATVEDAFEDYQKLLDQVGTVIPKDRLIVISIMPVTRIRLGDGSQDLNTKICATNTSLKNYCEQANIMFVDILADVSKDNMLREELTWDGLHLNQKGYQRLADSIKIPLLSLYGKIETH